MHVAPNQPMSWRESVFHALACCTQSAVLLIITLGIILMMMKIKFRKPNFPWQVYCCVALRSLIILIFPQIGSIQSRVEVSNAYCGWLHGRVSVDFLKKRKKDSLTHLNCSEGVDF